MKIFTEFIVLHEDGPMPNEEMFCPSFWKAKEFDADGDYYYDDIDGRWTNVEITKRYTSGNDSSLDVNVYRQNNRNYEPSVQEVEDLKRYVEYKMNGRYSYNHLISGIKNLCVTSLFFESYSIDDYQAFLKSVYSFLEYSNGVLINCKELDAVSFKEEFIDK
jgi:hypothetical protein